MSILRYEAFESSTFGTVMTLKNVLPSDEGEYKCVGSNSVDQLGHFFYINVQSKQFYYPTTPTDGEYGELIRG